MKLFLLTIKEYGGYDSYDSFVIAADSEEEARGFFGRSYYDDDRISCGDECDNNCSLGETHHCVWNTEDGASCEEIGWAEPYVKKGLILSSFNAG